VVDLKPIPLAHGHRVHGLNLPAVHLGKGPQSSRRGRGAPGRVRRLRADAGDERAGPLFSLGPSPRKCPGDLGEGLSGGPPAVLGDRGFRWVQGVKTPPYRVRGGRLVETGWRRWMGKVRNWIETRFSVMVRSLGLHRIEAQSFWGLAARVNLILLVHNLIRSRVLLRMAGVEL
jgi:hypothetical protein